MAGRGRQLRTRRWRGNPDYPEAHYNLGNVLLDQGKLDDAIDHSGRRLCIRCLGRMPHNNLGIAFAA